MCEWVRGSRDNCRIILLLTNRPTDRLTFRRRYARASNLAHVTITTSQLISWCLVIWPPRTIRTYFWASMSTRVKVCYGMVACLCLYFTSLKVWHVLRQYDNSDVCTWISKWIFFSKILMIDALWIIPDFNKALHVMVWSTRRKYYSPWVKYNLKI